MPNYSILLRKRSVLITTPGILDKGEWTKIKKRIAGAIEAGEKSGQFNFKSRLPEVGTTVIKWRQIKASEKRPTQGKRRS